MSYLGKAKECDMLSLGEEIGINIFANANITSLVKLIKKTEVFDEKCIKCRLEITHEESAIETAKEAKRVEIEEIDKDREFELRLLEISNRTGNLKSENMSKANNVKEILKTLYLDLIVRVI